MESADGKDSKGNWQATVCKLDTMSAQIQYVQINYSLGTGPALGLS